MTTATKAPNARKGRSKQASKPTRGSMGTVADLAVWDHNKRGAVIPDSNASGPTRLAYAGATAEHVVEVAPNLAMLKPNDAALTFPGLAGRYPLGVSKGGNFNGRLMNINEYCRLKYGRAWNDNYAARVLKEENVKLTVLPNKTEDDKKLRKAISKELDDMRPLFHADLKALAAAIGSRSDLVVTRLAVRETARGLTFNQTSTISNAGQSKEARLMAELERTKRELEAIKAVVPARALKAIKAAADENKAHDVDATVTDTGKAPEVPAAAAMVENVPATSTKQ